MAIVLIGVGLILFITAYNGTVPDAAKLLKDDVFSGNFIYWLLAIFVVGAIGYIKSLRGLSNAFLALLIIVLFLANGGFFDKFNSALAQITKSSK